jgi:hypothetical protein
MRFRVQGREEKENIREKGRDHKKRIYFSDHLFLRFFKNLTLLKLT